MSGHAAPERVELDESNPRTALRSRVAEALQALPGYFRSATNIEGILATDLFSLNTVLGATIEVQVVATLNEMRDVWDPDDEWQTYRFERQAQTFPDVRLVARDREDIDIALGVELKGWYLFAKEKEPSLRMVVTPDACADHDLIAVVPWYLSNVLSGEPVAREPWVESAKYVAEYRNYWWKHVRKATTDTTIKSPATAHPYPVKADEVSDKPVSDSGSNFGRLARAGLMEGYLEEHRKAEVAGIAAEHWIGFFKLYSDSSDHEAVSQRLERDYAKAVKKAGASADADRAVELLKELAELMRSS
ncbi:MAG: hypothetical protein M5U23_04585 [Acidimicrobiia bacterium]|nr:hypothetical protein [Acidimicrobiia bacterium]